MMSIRTIRLLRAAGLLAIALAGPITATPAQAQQAGRARDAGAEQFVDASARRVLAVLNKTQGGDAAKRAAFRTLIDEVVDVPKLTRFVLGKYARTITPEQYQRFAVVFRDYAEGVYQSRIDDYHGERAVVNGSVVRKPGDVIVSTTLGGGSLQRPTELQWRVLGSGNSWRVVDVQVKGIWLAITQQQDFVSTIDNAGGNINVLIAQLARDKNGTIHGR